jgi:putative addiction module killer protein
MLGVTGRNKVKIYADEVTGKEPFTEWFYSLKNSTTRNRILKRLERLYLGNFGDYKALGEGIYEMRLFFGGGYRVYFGKSGKTLVILLCGGNKRTQKYDIKKAQEYWNKYNE